MQLAIIRNSKEKKNLLKFAAMMENISQNSTLLTATGFTPLNPDTCVLVWVSMVHSKFRLTHWFLPNFIISPWTFEQWLMIQWWIECLLDMKNGSFHIFAKRLSWNITFIIWATILSTLVVWPRILTLKFLNKGKNIIPITCFNFVFNGFQFFFPERNYFINNK